MLDFIPTAHLIFYCGIFGVLAAGLFFAAVGAVQRRRFERARSMDAHPAGKGRQP